MLINYIIIENKNKFHMMKMMPCAMKYIDFINLVMKRR